MKKKISKQWFWKKNEHNNSFKVTLVLRRMLSQPLLLNPADLVSVAFVGTLEGLPLLGDREPSALCLNLKEQLTKIFYSNRENDLIRRYFNFTTSEAFVYSDEISRSLFLLGQSDALISLPKRPGEIITPSVKSFANGLLEKKVISAGD